MRKMHIAFLVKPLSLEDAVGVFCDGRAILVEQLIVLSAFVGVHV